MFDHPHPNLVAQIQLLQAMYRGVLDDAVLDGFLAAVRDADTLPPPPERQDAGRHLVVGDDPHSDSLVLVDRHSAQYAAQTYLARDWAETWGQYFEMHGHDLRDEFREAARYPTFEHFLRERFPVQPDRSLGEFWQDYCELSWAWQQRPPLDHEPFDLGAYEGWLIDSCCDMPDMRQLALETIPVAILREFATIESGGMMGGGDFVHLPRERKAELIAALEAAGFTVTEDQDLVAAAQNAGGGTRSILASRFAEEMLARFLRRVEAIADGQEWSVEDELAELDDE